MNKSAPSGGALFLDRLSEPYRTILCAAPLLAGSVARSWAVYFVRGECQLEGNVFVTQTFAIVRAIITTPIIEATTTRRHIVAAAEELDDLGRYF